MIIRETRGDLFDCSSQTIACPINTAGAMGKGLALEFRERVPGLHDYYQRSYGKPHNAEQYANVLTTYRVPDGRQVLLFPTKIHWRDHSPLDLVDSNLQLLAQRYRELGITSLALPALGCGLGGLNYERDLRPLLMRYLHPLPLSVEVLFQ